MPWRRAAPRSTLPPAAGVESPYVTRIRAALERLYNGWYLILPNGAKAYRLPVTGSSEVFLEAFRFTLESIVQVLLLTTTATLDTRHNSRAQSRTGQDVLGTLPSRPGGGE